MISRNISNLVMVTYCILCQIYNTQYAVPILKVPSEVLIEILPHYTDTVYFGAFEGHTSGPVEGW